MTALSEFIEPLGDRVLIRKDERAILGFHRFSLLVWLLWLVPFVTGVVIGMRS